MVVNVQQSTNATLAAIPIANTDLKRIARSLQRATLLRRYSHGTFKRSTMAMINIYIRTAAKNFAHHSGSMHAVM